MASAAAEKYDFSLFETSPRKLEKEKPLRVVEGGRRARSKPVEFAINAGYIFAAAFALAMILCMLVTNVRLTELTRQIDEQQDVLSQSMSEYSYLTAKYNDIANLQNVQEEARRLGLMQLDKSQITYIRSPDKGVITAADTNLDKITQYFFLTASSIADGDLSF